MDKLSIIPRSGGALGFTYIPPATEDRALLFDREIRGQLAMLMGGRAAEELTCDAVSTGAVSVCWGGLLCVGFGGGAKDASLMAVWLPSRAAQKRACDVSTPPAPQSAPPIPTLPPPFTLTTVGGRHPASHRPGPQGSERVRAEHNHRAALGWGARGGRR